MFNFDKNKNVVLGGLAVYAAGVLSNFSCVGYETFVSLRESQRSVYNEESKKNWERYGNTQKTKLSRARILIPFSELYSDEWDQEKPPILEDFEYDPHDPKTREMIKNIDSTIERIRVRNNLEQKVE